MNETFKVATALDCNKFSSFEMFAKADTLTRNNFLGCSVFELLLQMYKMNVTYVDLNFPNGTINCEADVFVVPRSLTLLSVDNLNPIFSIVNRRYGFLLRRHQRITHYYQVPFQRSVWIVLHAVCIFMSILFYLLNRWEKRVVRRYRNRECSYVYELLVAIGALCQRVPHIKAKLWSRRITYLIFFTFGYLVHCYYTSNLLSRLVNDRDSFMALDFLLESDYEIAMLGNMLLDVDSVIGARRNQNLNIMPKRFFKIVKMDVYTSIRAILSGKVAVFSDYVTIYPFIHRYFDDAAVCDLVHVDLYSNIKKYFFTSKQFPYTEQFKVGTLRLKEAGLMRRLMSNMSFTQPTCSNPPHIVPSLQLVVYPFILLTASFVSSLVVLGIENLHYKYTKNRRPKRRTKINTNTYVSKNVPTICCV